MTEPRPQMEQIIRDYIAWENGDASKVSAVSETVDVYNPGLPEGEVHSRAERDAYNQEVRAAFPDFHAEITDLVVDGPLGMIEV